MRAIVGVASVPLASLASGEPVEGAFKISNPVTRKPAGRLVLGLGWHNPLQLPGAPPKGMPFLGVSHVLGRVAFCFGMARQQCGLNIEDHSHA